MILTVALNAALDVTYHLDAPARVHHTHRVSRVDARAGGKANNTARVLHTLDTPVFATGLLGGQTGKQIAEAMPSSLRHAFVPVADESRRALVVADPQDATGFWEPGPQVTDMEWAAFQRRYLGLLKLVTVVVLSGSLQRGLAADSYAKLVHAARQHGVATIVDCDGPALAAAIEQRPDVIKPNTDELAAAVPDIDTSSVDGVFAATRQLRHAGARTVVASRGAHGIAVDTGTSRYCARVPEVLPGNPTGAGDACVAAIARGFHFGSRWPESVTEAVALSTAAVKAPTAGTVSVADYLRYRQRIEIEEL